MFKYSVLVALIDPNNHANNTSEYFNATTEDRAVELADAFVKAVHNEKPHVQASFKLQERKWKDIPFSNKSMEVLGR